MNDSEAHAQSMVRLAAPDFGYRLWRNNNGVLPNPETKRPVRFGLGNESKTLNDELKSSDLVGWKRTLITPDMVGYIIARAVSVEMKPPGWKYRGDAHERAQKAWLDLLISDGGIGLFATGPEDLPR